jgi:pimeloyl-ACP methyl ester carboxylesterase
VGVEARSGAVEVDGLRLGYRRAGSGEPLLLLHGGFSDGREWQPQLDGLSDRFDVIAMDCLGCGRSDDPPAGFTLTDYADVVAGVVRKLRLDRLHLGGISMGSVYALAVYGEHPGIVRSLLLVSAYAGWAGSLAPEEVEHRVRWAEDAFARPVDEWGAEFLRTVYADGAPQSLIDDAFAVLRDVRAEGFSPVARTFFAADVGGVLSRIRVPTLLVAGELDERAPTAVAESMRKRIEGARLMVIPGAGHGVNGEAPEQFNAAVREFLSAQPKR